MRSQLKTNISSTDTTYIKELIKEVKLQHPQIIYYQYVIESGRGTSRLAREQYNLFGMTVPSKRWTLGIRENKSDRFLTFKSIRDCLIDLKIWQITYANNLSEKEYLNYLRTFYIKDKKYLKVFLGY